MNLDNQLPPSVRLQNRWNTLRRKFNARQANKKLYTTKRVANSSDRRRKGSGFKISWSIKLIIPIAIIGFVIAVVINGWFQFSPTNLPGLADREPPVVSGNRLYVAAYIYETINGYDYIDALALMAADYTENKLATTFISAEYYTRTTGQNYIQVRNILSNAQSAGESKIEALNKYLEGTLGLPVDRYLAINKYDLPELMGNLGITGVRAVDEFSDPDAGTFKVGEFIPLDRVINYLSADQVGFNRKMLRASNIWKQLMSEASNWQWWRALFNSYELSQLAATDMSKSEMYGLFNFSLGAASKPAEYLSINESLLISAPNGDVLVPSTVKVDDKIRQLYARERVIREQARIEIYNASRVNGVATTYRRQLYNHGANVIRAGNYADLLEETTLYVPNPTAYPQTVNLVKELMRGKVEVKEEAYPFNHTAELVLVIGTSAI